MASTTIEQRMSAALSPDCSFDGEDRFVDRTVFSARSVAIGTFRCPVRHPSFRDTGPIERHIVVFPRTAVWIRHAGSRSFLADPSLATIYSAAQQYERFPASPEGDRCDWFAVSDALAREIVRVVDPRAAQSDRPFRNEWASTSTRLYLRQRSLLRRAARGDLEELEGEEAVIIVVEEVIAGAYRRIPSRTSARDATSTRHRELVDAARAELLRTVHVNHSLHDVAAAIGSSPYHLCRVFRACVGRTLAQYRLELRLRLALERFELAMAATNLSAVAHDLGFSSHSHFVRAMRRYAGATPSAVRAFLQKPYGNRTTLLPANGHPRD